MSVRCDECGAPSTVGATRCARCGAAVTGEAPPLRYDHPDCLRGWSLLHRATVAYAAAQVALAPFSAAPQRGARLVMLIPFVAAPLWMARSRAGAWLSPWAALLCAGTLVALGFMLLGGTAPAPVQAMTLGTSTAWVAATALAAWRVREGARRGSVAAAASAPRGHDTPATRPVD